MFIRKLKINTFLSDFRDASPLALLMATPAVVASQGEGFLSAIQPYRPIIDGDEFLQSPLPFFQTTMWNTDKKILLGFTAEEFASVKFRTPNISRSLFLVSKNHHLTLSWLK